MNIIYCSAEVEPYAKSGGLGDVLGALPKAVAHQGHAVSVVMPKYTRVIKSVHLEKMKYVGYMFVDVNWRHQYCGVFKIEEDNVTYYFLDNEYYFGGDLYCFADIERFTFFSKACLDLVSFLGKKVDVIHCNDWSTGVLPTLFDAFYRKDAFYSDIKLIYTIHNLRYQGIVGQEQAKDLTGLPDNFFTYDKLMHRHSVNYMKAGIVFSDRVTTVSPTYADEILTDEYSEWLGDVINHYSYKMEGILNGIDYTVYNPAIDSMIACQYDQTTVRVGKATNKAQLQAQLGLPIKDDVMLIGLVSRLVDQKGMDLIGAILDRLLTDNIQLVVVGTGEKRYEDMLTHFASCHSDKLSANILFDNSLAHKVYAACDLFLVPSLFEPCGLSQLISLKYGTLPLVRETGGLKDTVTSYNQYTGEGNGFSFAHYNANDLLYTIRRAIEVYNNDKECWYQLVTTAMNCNYSWDSSSKQYIAMYKKICNIVDKKPSSSPKPRASKTTKQQ